MASHNPPIALHSCCSKLLAHLDLIWRNWFCIDLRKRYAKPESGTNLIMFDVY
jgi:hypothetical protein